MKNLLLLVLMSFGIMFSNAQNVSSEIVVNPLILEFYPETKVDYMLAEEPEMIVYWNAIYDFGYEIAAIPEMKSASAQEFTEVEINDLDNVNILAMNLFPIKGANQYFRIKNTDKVLIVKSEDFIRKELSK